MIAGGESVGNCVGLRGHDFLAAIVSSADAVEIVAAAFGENAAGKDFDDDVGIEELGQFIGRGAGFNGLEVLAREGQILRGIGHSRCS